MNKPYKLMICLIFAILCSSVSYAVSLTRDDVAKMHQGFVAKLNRDCIAGGRSAATCNCLSLMVSSKLNDSALLNCDATTATGMGYCMLKFMGDAKGSINRITIANCEKNPNSAGRDASGAANSSSQSKITKIVLLLVSLLAAIWLAKVAFFNQK